MNGRSTTNDAQLGNADWHWRQMPSGYCRRTLTLILASGFAAAQMLLAAGAEPVTVSNLERVEASASTDSDSMVEGESRDLSLARQSIKTLSASLASANSEAEFYRQRYCEMEKRILSLGLESLGKDQSKLEQRLLNAVADLRLVRKERDEYRDQMLGLSEAVVRLLKTSTGDAVARLEVEAQLRASDQLVSSLREGDDEVSTLLDARVVSVKEEWSLVVGNIGEKQGVRVGMPLRVTRDDKLVAMLQVVDVRRKICGAIIQEMDSGRIYVGDRLQVDVR